MFEHIEQLKRDYTDKYVVVDETRPELRRFHGQTGTVRTVNMNGRALVEFDGLANIGWFDIGLDFLKVIDQPLPKAEPKSESKPAKAKPESKAGAKTAEKSGGGKMSVADMLAAARGEKPAGGAPAKPAAAAKPASKEPAAEKPAKKGGGMSVADMLAAARAEKTGEAEPPAAAATEETVVEEPVAEEPAVEEAVADEPAAEEPAASQSPPVGDLPTDTAGICQWCRERDGS